MALAVRTVGRIEFADGTAYPAASFVKALDRIKTLSKTDYSTFFDLVEKVRHPDYVIKNTRMSHSVDVLSCRCIMNSKQEISSIYKAVVQQTCVGEGFHIRIVEDSDIFIARAQLESERTRKKYRIQRYAQCRPPSPIPGPRIAPDKSLSALRISDAAAAMMSSPSAEATYENESLCLSHRSGPSPTVMVYRVGKAAMSSHRSGPTLTIAHGSKGKAPELSPRSDLSPSRIARCPVLHTSRSGYTSTRLHAEEATVPTPLLACGSRSLQEFGLTPMATQERSHRSKGLSRAVVLRVANAAQSAAAADAQPVITAAAHLRSGAPRQLRASGATQEKRSASHRAITRLLREEHTNTLGDMKAYQRIMNGRPAR